MSLAFVWEIHRRPLNSPHKGPVTRKMFPFDDVIMCESKIRWRRKQNIRITLPKICDSETRLATSIHYWSSVRTFHWWPVDLHHRGTTMWNTFPCHDVISTLHDKAFWWQALYTEYWHDCFEMIPPIFCVIKSHLTVNVAMWTITPRPKEQILSNRWNKSHLDRQQNCWSLICSWGIACRCCSS